MPMSRKISKIERAAHDEVLEGLPVEEFHGDESFASFVADVVDSANVGVIEGRGGLGFTLEAGEDLRVAGYIVGKKFKSDKAMKTSVFRFVNDAHASATELLDDAVVGDGLSDERGGVGHCGAIL
jgi:hypothetical protein